MEESKEVVLQIDEKTRVQVTKKGRNVLVDIREMYTDGNGKLQPGRKGFCFSAEGWGLFQGLVGDIDLALKQLQEE
ncbi:unnamed protein product [Moneuplotes crassus]|uniref:Transcriptional coactivator p15 (PC4) C-terminal domain-containing protein n=1 Tax=Euplotes crassus TaxID=5936 RepID=A0AAD1Y7V8_EUPCR|nr:unnamed protein product [Moneuplotes crassus]